jgi:hypothetical protein
MCTTAAFTLLGLVQLAEVAAFSTTRFGRRIMRYRFCVEIRVRAGKTGSVI